MSTPLACPDLECLQTLDGDTLSLEERDWYVRHLETCSTCQERLDRVAVLPDALQGLARQVGDPTAGSADSTRDQFLEWLHEGAFLDRPVAAEPADLYFLRQGDRPDLLGFLGEYEVREVIGQGGMGVVLKAFDPALNRLVAIKVMSAAVAGSAVARRRFAREAQAAAAVQHENVVPVFGVYEADGLPYLVMQYIAGKSLQDRLDRVGALPVEEVVRIGVQTAAGLAAAHARGLIHRDVKPANLLLASPLRPIGPMGPLGPMGLPGAEEDLCVKITDFGLARMIDDVALTRNGVVAGTPEYMAPEQARGETVDHRADLFSLGSVLYAMCTGAPPFRGSTAVSVLRQVSDQTPPPLSEINPDAPAWLAEIVDRLMAKDPADRFQSAAEVADLLADCRLHLGRSATVEPAQLHFLPRRNAPEEPEPWFGGLFRSFSLPRWLAVVGVLIVLGVLVSLFFPQNNDPTKRAGKDGEAPGKQDHLLFDLRTSLDRYPALSLIGPEAASRAKTDEQGLRFALPEGREDASSVGLELAHRIRGDFDIVLGYELLAIGAPTPKYGAGVRIRLWFDAPSPFSVVVDRSRRTYGEEFATHWILGPEGQEQYKDFKNDKATRQKGKLRLTRMGEQLRFLVADEGQPFRVLQSLPIGTHDVKTLRVLCQTEYTPITLDARFSELDVRADRIGAPGRSARADSPAAAPETEAPKGGGEKATIVGVGALLFLAAVSGLWLFARHRRRGKQGRTSMTAPAPNGNAEAAASFACSSCGKRLKARADLAGKKVKCIHCGRPTLVAGSEPV